MLTVASLAVPALASRSARAWGFDEHSEIGANGYRAACADVAAKFHIDTTANACEHPASEPAIRWCSACNNNLTPELYGQSVAIAGDHVADPKQLMSANGQEIAASIADYAFLALVNVDHFHPRAPRNWQAYHTKALELAAKAGPSTFAEVFYTSAFADHFLQDAFSAGHAGFNRPSSGAVASKGFHDIWNHAGRVVQTPAGDCWLEYGDGRLKDLSPEGRKHIDEAERASVTDVLSTFVSGARDSGREGLPLYFVPAKITSNALPHEVVTEVPTPTQKLVFDAIEKQRASFRMATTATGQSCPVEAISIDEMSNPAVINGGVNFWLSAAADRSTTRYGSADVVYNHHLFDVMSLRFAGDLGAGVGAVRRDGRDAFAPSVLAGLLLPPLYWVHGLWRNELGLQARSYLVAAGPVEVDGYGSVFIRSSLEVATWIPHLQVGPTVDFRTGHWGAVASLGIEFARWRWISGGGPLKDF